MVFSTDSPAPVHGSDTSPPLIKGQVQELCYKKKQLLNISAYLFVFPSDGLVCVFRLGHWLREILPTSGGYSPSPSPPSCVKHKPDIPSSSGSQETEQGIVFSVRKWGEHALHTATVTDLVQRARSPPCRGPGDREHRGDIHNVASRVPTPQS